MINRILDFVGIGRITRSDDSGNIQLLQITEGAVGQGGDDRVIENVRRLIEFGFSSLPPIDSEVVMIRRAADRSLSIAIASNHRASRPRDLAAGDTVIYDLRGNQVRLTADGIEVRAADAAVKVSGATTVTVTASEKVRVEAPTLECTGDVVSRADGSPVSLNALRDAYDAHKHGGVSTGTSSTAITDHPV